MNTITTSNWITLGEHPIDPSLDISVTLQKNTPKNGELTTYKGIVELPLSLTRIAFTLEDSATRKKWVNRLAEHTLILKSEDGLQFDTYEHYDMSWPVSDRDYIVHQEWKINDNSPSPSISLFAHSIENEQYPIRKDRVRGNLQRLVYTLEYIGQNKTRMEVEIQVDPKGNLPSFFANIIQKNWPVNTLKTIYNEAKKEGREHQLINEKLHLD